MKAERVRTFNVNKKVTAILPFAFPIYLVLSVQNIDITRMVTVLYFIFV